MSRAAGRFSSGSKRSAASMSVCRCRKSRPVAVQEIISLSVHGRHRRGTDLRPDVHADRSQGARRAQLTSLPGARSRRANRWYTLAPRGSDRLRFPVSGSPENVLHRIRHRSSVRSRARAPPPGHVHRHLPAQPPRARSRRQLASMKRSAATPRKSTSSCTRTIPCRWRTTAAACRSTSTRRKR